MSLLADMFAGRRLRAENQTLQVELAKTQETLRTLLAESEQADHKLRVEASESEEQFLTLAQSIPQLAWMARPDGHIFWYNDRWFDYTGTTLTDMQGWKWQSVHHPKHVDGVVERISEAFRSGDPWEDTFPLRAADGSYRWFLSRARPIRNSAGEITRWFGTNTDIDDVHLGGEAGERERIALRLKISGQDDLMAEGARDLALMTADRDAAEGQLRQLQKLDAVGQLTAGIAHDFNNMLAVVIGALTLLSRRLERGDTDVQKYVDAAQDGAARAATLTQRLLAFSRQQPLAPESLDANKFVGGMTDLLMRSLGERVRLDTALGAGLWRVHIDAGGLENAILNLAVNARDAMPEGGKLTVETGNASVDESYGELNDIKPGQYVMIAVTDTGGGMPAEVIERAFDPFYTTKSVGKGTGLGLSQIYGFVRQSHGSVKIYSEVGVGTTVKLYLPRFVGEETPAKPRKLKNALKRGLSEEVILVVEDEDRVRIVSVDALRELGYTVVHAANGEEALQLLDSGQAITLLFTDIVMPGMTGKQLADAAVARLPELKVLYTTGYTRNAVVHNGVIDPGTNYLSKPFTLESLGAKIRDVLDG
ncbi:ATP-binding protein [Caulobacter segnis]|uniref:hybrid sensor histidine kinase/response regulator n=1 Tax=Caulobacter segnis TaxID=88688 RepID=UPI0024106BCB|nr:PAS domain-containing hybrid sensor histidine kinase/response regulator [Caulobacter segnis]MDG2520602.1 ATP-binding protein [Caulobacter segnis]